MIDSIFSAKNNNEADVVIIGAPYEKTASSHKGTVNGPQAVMKMLDSKLELFDRTYKIEPCDKIKIGQKNLDDIKTLSPAKAIAKIRTETGKILDKNKFVFLLGGEHSVSLGFFQALSKKYNPKNVTILHIDAHCDLRDSDADYNEDSSNLAHSCVMRRAHELGYNLVQVGIRTYYKDEYKYFTDPKNNIKVFEWGNSKKVPSIAEILESIKTKYVHITIDVDGFDPAHMPGTGTAVQGGLEWWYGIELIERVIDAKHLIGADIVEVSPMRDSILTEYGAAQLCYTIIAHKFLNKLKK
ncbi:agmatinase [Candidatus Nomurabacteria bacterium RIFCSPHIGHO2_02_FULL_37_45]|uniref:Agmatinase n=1 Tax=Candidatus Nomurabacteria bacterium RIFCSPHIGHO2_12_FULL_37_29 TaxID=1801759 RepID=A0A1F6WCD6_9BACT|nr:MAG: agmatinase [Candidatus Nomurabacteria bacterium RIFCSPHIGHO2_01_FULL_37_110]OGI71450.1 MAG: agmatinase [Candidatus Nomurabacteria bacterium RIFCSPHIGHO2_02_FULL_37_45]OGI79568.1 MAG: agmatinase [Candidatus Nomurabacteria bacterium RIFCSPHIGHO2_12_FULL_37_29]OGI85452.1 MAG: agmatinase [Candidatus Nomurabacteria bacterium RIFCSPLOWO2_01_FULL_37_49]